MEPRIIRFDLRDLLTIRFFASTPFLVRFDLRDCPLCFFI